MPPPPDGPVYFNWPAFFPLGLEYARAAYDRGHVSGDGEFTRRCEAALQECVGSGKVLLTTSCTDALELAALLLEIGPGDEVIVPAFTFVSTANAGVLRGARPVFVDVRPDTYNLDEKLVGAALRPKTKAIVAVHYGGVGCEMDAIQGAAGPGVSLIEDNAHGLFGSYRDRPLGSLGRLSTLSFHETKNLSCGEGGALVINDPALRLRAEILREKGTDRARFFRGEVDRYTWRDVGSSFLPSDILAALLWAQIEAREKIQDRRREIHERYRHGLGDWARAQGIALPVIPTHCRPSYHLFTLLLPTAAARSAFIQHLRERQIHAVFHYQPLHLTPMGRRLGGQPGQCPVAEDVAERIVRLPFYYDLTPASQDRVIEAARLFAPA
jgi:dTDP-4-amino-4,6-dideoxygalactose transaminase